jgi:tetratricopeptide (TPR) repeat protein
MTKLELSPLREQDVADLIAARVTSVPGESVAAFAKRVRDESAGSPFFVCELLDHLSATGELERLVGHGPGYQLPIPDSVRDVVGQRLGRLPEEAGELLSTAAVIGLTFDLELLAGVVHQTPELVLGVIEEVARVAVVHEVDAGRFSFDHAIVRTTLLERMTATRRALAHRRVAETIEQLRPADHDELAHHWLLAGDADRATFNLELAARRDLEALAYESAAERYQAVLDHHLGRTGDLATTARAWLGFGLARRALGQADYIASIEEAGRVGRKLHDTDVVAAAAIASVWPGTFFVTPGRTQTGLVELCEDALDLVDDTDPRRSRILSTLAAHLMFDDDRDRRIDLLGEAQSLARSIGDPELIGSVLVAEFLSLWDPTTSRRRTELTSEVARMARASGDVDLEFFAGFFAAIGAAERCDVHEARARLATLAGPVTKSQNPYFGFLADRLLVSFDVLAARPGVQDEVDALAAKYAGTHADTTGTWSLQSGGLALQRGELGALAPAIRTMMEQSEIARNWKPPLGLALLDSGDRAGAMAVLDEFEAPPLDYFWLTTMQAWAELAVGLARRDLIVSAFDELSPYREQLGITASGTLCFGLVGTTLGQLAGALHEHAAAVELLDEAVGRADAMGAPFEAVKSRRVLAAAMLRSGRPAHEVAPVVGVATAMARQHGFNGELILLSQLELAAARPG